MSYAWKDTRKSIKRGGIPKGGSRKKEEWGVFERKQLYEI